MTWCVRTTLTLDPDVAVQLDRLQRERGGTFKQLVNDALRHGLQQMRRPQRLRSRFQTRTASLGRCLIASLDDVTEVLSVAEGDRFR